MTALLATMAEARQGFLELVGEVRPELHRYCARMTGSIFDGEDVVQETLAKACFALAEMDSPPPLRPWLFRIAHNTAMDFLRRYERRNVQLVADLEEVADMDGPDLDGERVDAALEVFAGLTPVQRSALALKDVLGLSLEETAATMEMSVGAVKAALVRARANVAAARKAASQEPPDLERIRRYAALFNARDWEGLRALFGEETRLDVVSRTQRQGAPASEYFTRYAEIAPREQLRAVPGWVGGVPVLAVFRAEAIAYFVRLDWRGERIGQVRDYRYVPYITREAEFSAAASDAKSGDALGTEGTEA